MLHDLLRIKKIREKAAQDEVKKCEYRVEQAIIQVKEKEEALEAHIIFRTEEEKRLYDEIMNTHVTERALDLVKRKVMLMREKDLEFQEAIKQAKNELEKQQAALEESKILYSKAMQMVEKFKEFTRIIDKEADKEAQRKEELELEEFSVKNRL